VIGWKQRRARASDVQHDRARFEQHHIIVPIAWYLRKRLQSTVGRREFFLMRDEFDLIWEPGLFEGQRGRRSRTRPFAKSGTQL
jgi:hypothetical protein